MNPNETFFASIRKIHTMPALEKELGHRYVNYNVCIHRPQKLVAGDSLWASHTIFPPQSSFTMLEMQIVSIFLVTQSFHFFLKRFGFSQFVSQVMAGFLLGPSIPTGGFEKYKKMLFPFGSPDILNTLSSFGYAFFLFINSVQMDLTLITKTGKKAWFIALLSFITPIILGVMIMAFTQKIFVNFVGNYEYYSIPVILISHSSCSFTVIALLLNDLGILNSELGRLALSTGLLNDIGGSIVAGVGTALIGIQVSQEPNRKLIAIRDLFLYLGYLIFIPLVGRPVMMWMVKNTPEGKPIKKIYIHIIVVTFVYLGFLAGDYHQPFYMGAVMLGLAVPEGPPLGSELVNLFELFATWFLTPIFVTCCTMKVDLTKFAGLKLVLFISAFILMVHLIKLLICVGICRYCKMPSTDGLCLSLILSCKGVCDACSFILVYDAWRQSEEAIGVMVISVLILGTISKIGVKSLYDPSRKYAGYQKRNIMNLKKNSELRLVACVHKQSHMIHIKNFLHLCSPSPQNSLIADVLHLMELVGRTTPIFIAHRLQHKLGSSQNYSRQLVLNFDFFEQDYAGSAMVSTYTAISPIIYMHEDVCTLALDKNASIIILPFHIRWTEDGSIESKEDNIRSINLKVLERAPCSIGILVNRCNNFSHNSDGNKVAMVFLGGPDDREALCLAKRFVKNLDNTLFVFRLFAFDHDSTQWENMIDDEELRVIRGAYVKLENVKYEEKTINDASETTTFIREISNKFDIILVGRRNGVKSPQTTGLDSWTEYSELGVIGDLLASPDMECKASILVVQQQQQQTTKDMT